MRKYTLAFCSMFLLAHSCTAQQVDTTNVVNSLLKCWHAVSHEYSTIYGLDEDEIKNYSQQKVCFTRDTITMYYGAVYAPHFSIRKVNAESYARDNFDCGKVKLGMITDSVYEITISSMVKSSKNGALHKMTDVVAFDGDFLYMVKDGVIFKLYDSNSKNNPRNSN